MDAAKPSTEDEALEALKAASLVVNSVGSMIQPTRTERPTAFSEATDFLGDAIKAARAAKQVEIKNTKTGTVSETTTEQPSLAELLARSAAGRL